MSLCIRDLYWKRCKIVTTADHSKIAYRLSRLFSSVLSRARCMSASADINVAKLAEFFVEKVKGLRAAAAVVCSSWMSAALQLLWSFHFPISIEKVRQVRTVHPSSGKSWQWLPYLPCGHQHGAASVLTLVTAGRTLCGPVSFLAFCYVKQQFLNFKFVNRDVIWG